MYIQLTTITQAKQQRDFYIHSDKLELVFDLAYSISQLGETVTKVSYFDRKGELVLPIETVHPPLLINPFSQLKKQWESILASPVSLELSKMKSARRQNEHLAIIKQKQLHHFQQLQLQMQQLLETTQINLKDGPRRKRLLALHQQTIQRCQQSMAQIEAYSR